MDYFQKLGVERAVVRRVVVALISVGVIIGITVAVSNLSLSITPGGSDEKTLKKVAISLEDTDGDGLPDFEEALWGTNLEKADSDGDGATDGEEVASGRDPKIAGPDDKIVQVFATTTREDVAERQKEFFKRLLEERGDDINNLTLEVLIDKNKQVAATISAQYGLSDMSTLSGATVADYKNYGNELGTLFRRYGGEIGEDETEIFAKAVEMGDIDLLSKLQKPALYYKNLSGELRSMRVPLSLAEYHLLLVNGYDVMSRSLTAMTAIFDNPLVANTAYTTYLAQMVLIKNGFFNIVYDLDERGIAFDQTEGGYILTRILWTEAEQ